MVSFKTSKIENVVKISVVLKINNTKNKTKKCQPGVGRAQDLIQTCSSPYTWGARPKTKKTNKQKTTTKPTIQKTQVLSKFKLLSKMLSNGTLFFKSKYLLIKKTKKCQTVARGAQDLIQTWGTPDIRLARHKKISERKKYKQKDKCKKIKIKKVLSLGCSVSKWSNQKTKKWKPDAECAQDLIQTCSTSVIGWKRQKTTKNQSYKKLLSLGCVSKYKNKTKKCLPGYRVCSRI